MFFSCLFCVNYVYKKFNNAKKTKKINFFKKFLYKKS